jgi:hypothetical protein
VTDDEAAQVLTMLRKKIEECGDDTNNELNELINRVREALFIAISALEALAKYEDPQP